MSEFKVGDKVVWVDYGYAEMWYPETVDMILTVSNVDGILNDYLRFHEFSNGEYVLAKRFKKCNAKQGKQMKIRVNTDIYEYMGLKKGEIVDAYPMIGGNFSFTLNGKTWVLNHKDVMVMDSSSVLEEQPTTKVKSNGGSSDYYKLTITNKKGETFECETGDVIRCMLGNDFSLGNCLKALRRMYLDSIGSGKEGVDLEYDGNKVKWFTDEFVHFNKKEKSK